MLFRSGGARRRHAAQGQILAVLLVLALVLPGAPAARVNDYAGLLSAAERDGLEQALARGDRATGVQMVIAIFPSLEGENLEDTAIRLAQRWRIGQKKLDDGVILVLFVKERRVRLEVGYGLEPVVPDAAAGAIIREVIAPRFRAGQYARGLDDAVAAVFARVAQARGGEARGTPPPRRTAAPAPSPLWMLGLVVIFVGIGIYLLREAAGSQRYARRNVYSTGRDGWHSPAVIVPLIGWGGGGGGGGASGGFSGGGGSFGGGGASGRW